jgi:hypothetical protein
MGIRKRDAMPAIDTDEYTFLREYLGWTEKPAQEENEEDDD